jgi:hypothetical protein
MKQLNDGDVFPFGRYFKSKTKMKDVPSSYLDWLMSMKWIVEWPSVVEYIRRNRKAIDQDLKRAGRI